MFVYRAKEPPFLCFSMILNLSYCIRTGVVLFVDQLQWSLSGNTSVSSKHYTSQMAKCFQMLFSVDPFTLSRSPSPLPCLPT